MKLAIAVTLLLAQLGSIFAITISAETNTFTISPQTLPVQLSSFSAIQLSGNLVKLNWVTESETGLSGFRIYRGEDPDLDLAIQISGAIIPGTNSSTTHVYSFVDYDVEPLHGYTYWLESVDLDGGSQYYSPINIHVSPASDPDNPPPILPLASGITGIYPNPFNPYTHLSFHLDTEALVRVEVYNHRGQLIRHLMCGVKGQGTHSVTWDGKDNLGQGCASGIYHFRVESTGNWHEVRKAVLMK